MTRLKDRVSNKIAIATISERSKDFATQKVFQACCVRYFIPVFSTGGPTIAIRKIFTLRPAIVSVFSKIPPENFVPYFRKEPEKTKTNSQTFLLRPSLRGDYLVDFSTTIPHFSFSVSLTVQKVSFAMTRSASLRDITKTQIPYFPVFKDFAIPYF